MGCQKILAEGEELGSNILSQKFEGLRSGSRRPDWATDSPRPFVFLHPAAPVACQYKSVTHFSCQLAHCFPTGGSSLTREVLSAKIKGFGLRSLFV